MIFRQRFLENYGSGNRTRTLTKPLSQLTLHKKSEIDHQLVLIQIAIISDRNIIEKRIAKHLLSSYTIKQIRYNFQFEITHIVFGLMQKKNQNRLWDILSQMALKQKLLIHFIH